MVTRVKFCGMTREHDIKDAVQLGCDAVGLVFNENSARALSVSQGQALAHCVPPYVSIVAVFADAYEQDVHDVLTAMPIDVLQFHGDEPAAYCASFSKPYIKTLAMSEQVDVAAFCEQHSHAQGILLDTKHPHLAGGTGEVFDWSWVPAAMPKPMILAGGLKPDNVAEAIQQTKPYAVDLVSGIEQSKGIKDYAKMQQFIKAVRQANND